MNLEDSNNDAKKDTNDSRGLPDDEIEQDIVQTEDEISGTREENEQVKRELSFDTSNPNGTRTVNVTIDNVNYTLPLNISPAQIDEIFPKLDRVPYNEDNALAIFNYLQTYHFAYKQLEAQHSSAQKTIQTYEEDMRALNEFRDQVSNESSEYHTKMKDLETKNKLLLEYIASLRNRFTTYISQQFNHGFERMKEADELTGILSAEFTYQESDNKKHEHN